MPVAPSPWADFDAYCEAKGIEPGEEGPAFAAFLHERTGWDGPAGPVEPVPDLDIVDPERRVELAAMRPLGRHEGLPQRVEFGVGAYDALPAMRASQRPEDLPWAPLFGRRCRARKEPNESGFWGRCELAAGHAGDHALERGMDTPRWSTEWTA